MSQKDNILQELTELNSSLAKIRPVNPYSVPVGYFDELLPELMNRIKALEAPDVREETETLSPLLGGLSRKMPFSIPEGYFENEMKLPVQVRESGKVIPIASRKWFRYAAAAVVTGVFVIAGYFLISQRNQEPGGRALAKFTRDIKKLNETQKENLIEFIDVTPGNGQVNNMRSNDVRELLKGIPAEELQDLAQQTEDMGDVLMIN